MPPFLDNYDIQLVGVKKIWQIYAKDQNKMFRLLSPLRIIVSNGLEIGMRKVQHVEFNINDLAWIDSGEPKNIEQLDTYGDCDVTIKIENNGRLDIV